MRNINGRAVTWVCAALAILYGLYISILRILESFRWNPLVGNTFVYFDADRLVPFPWMADWWFVALVMIGIAVPMVLACGYLSLPPEERDKFHPSNLRWRHLREECLVVASLVVALLVPTSIIGVYVRVVLAGGFIGMAGMYFDLPYMEKGGAAWFMGGLYLYPVIWFGTKERVLFVGAVPSAVVWLIIATAKIPTLTEGDRVFVEFMFLFSMMWTIPLLLWAPVNWGLLRLARVWRKKAVRGPLTDLIALSCLMAPWVLAAFILPQLINAHYQMFTIIATIIVGLLWSKVISEPFAKLVHVLRERPASGTPRCAHWGRLDA